MERILITGSNRGIGLGLVKVYLERGDVHIFAACRQPDQAEALNDLSQQYTGNVTLVALDINDADTIAAAVETVSAKTDALDVLINNAGIFPDEDRSRLLGQLSAPQLNRVVTTNSVSPVIVTQAFAALLKNSNNPRMAMISSNMGSITNAANARGSYGYRMSKAAMNMAAVLLSNDMPDVTVVTIHPGWVQTDMGGSEAALTPEMSAQGIMTVVADLTAADDGAFYDYGGETLPW